VKKATRLNAQGSSVIRHWRPGELSAHVARELSDQRREEFFMVAIPLRYRTVSLPMSRHFSFDEARRSLPRTSSAHHQIRGLLLFSYQPHRSLP